MMIEVSKQCCKWHNSLPKNIQIGSLPDISEDRNLCGIPTDDGKMMCCAECPKINRKIIEGGLDFAKEIAEQQ